MATASAFIDIPATADQVWQLIGGFNSLPDWLPLVATSESGEGGRLRPIVRPSLRSGSLAPVLFRGHAATGHPGPSRLSRHPCRSTHSTEPPLALPGGQADQKHSALEAADRPACLE